MKHHVTRLLAASALAAALGATPALAQADISEWDENGDGILTQEEFKQAFGDTAAFSDWDTDGDGVLSEDEYRAGVFSTYDSNGDGQLDNGELGRLEHDIRDL